MFEQMLSVLDLVAAVFIEGFKFVQGAGDFFSGVKETTDGTGALSGLSSALSSTDTTAATPTAN